VRPGESKSSRDLENPEHRGTRSYEKGRPPECQPRALPRERTKGFTRGGYREKQGEESREETCRLRFREQTQGDTTREAEKSFHRRRIRGQQEGNPESAPGKNKSRVHRKPTQWVQENLYEEEFRRKFISKRDHMERGPNSDNTVQDSTQSFLQQGEDDRWGKVERINKEADII